MGAICLVDFGLYFLNPLFTFFGVEGFPFPFLGGGFLGFFFRFSFLVSPLIPIGFSPLGMGLFILGFSGISPFPGLGGSWGVFFFALFFLSSPLLRLWEVSVVLLRRRAAAGFS